MAHEKLIIGLLGLGLFVFGVYLMATNLEGMINSVFSQNQTSIGIAVVFGFAICGLLIIGLLFMFASLGAFEYKQQSKVKIYKGSQSEECIIDGMEEQLFGKTKVKNETAQKQFLYVGERLVFYDLSEGSYEEVDTFVKQGYKILAGYGGMYHRLVLEKPVNNEATEQLFDKVKVVRGIGDYTVHLVCEGKRLTVSFIDNDQVMITGTQMDSFYIGQEPARPTNDRGLFVKLVTNDRRTDQLFTPEKTFKDNPIKVLEFSQMLDKMKTFDPSDIRLGDEFPFDGLQKVNGESYIGKADAEWMEDHIIIYCKKWGLGFPYANTMEYIMFVLNHEYLHHYIFTVMLEDGLDIDRYDGHWPMFAGEIDLVCGLSTSNLSRTYFESKESFEVSTKLLANCSKKPDWSFVQF